MFMRESQVWKTCGYTCIYVLTLSNFFLSFKYQLHLYEKHCGIQVMHASLYIVPSTMAQKIPGVMKEFLWKHILMGSSPLKTLQFWQNGSVVKGWWCLQDQFLMLSLTCSCRLLVSVNSPWSYSGEGRWVAFVVIGFTTCWGFSHEY